MGEIDDFHMIFSSLHETPSKTIPNWAIHFCTTCDVISVTYQTNVPDVDVNNSSICHPFTRDRPNSSIHITQSLRENHFIYQEIHIKFYSLSIFNVKQLLSLHNQIKNTESSRLFLSGLATPLKFWVHFIRHHMVLPRPKHLALVFSKA